MILAVPLTFRDHADGAGFSGFYLALFLALIFAQRLR